MIDRSKANESPPTVPKGQDRGASHPVIHRLRTFGGLAIEGPEGVLNGRVAHRHPLALLALLAAGAEQRCTRDKLVGLLWGECDEHRARHNLADTLYILRRTLGTEAVLSAGPSVQLTTDVVWTDVGAFAAALERGALEEAVTLYQGPFLDGFHLAGAPDFEQWTESERHRVDRQCAEALSTLAECAESCGDHVRALSWWQRAAEHHPYDSQIALRLCEAFATLGDRGGALRALLEHEHRMQRELGIDPDGAVLAVKEGLQQPQCAVAPPSDRRWRGRPDTHPRAARPTKAAQMPAVGSDDSPGASVRRQRRPIGIRLGVAGGGLMIAAAAVYALYGRPNTTLDPDRIVVPTFDRVAETVDPLVAEGLARLVSLSLDGVGPLRSVILSRTRTGRRRAVDDQSADRLAREAGAGLLLFANLAPAGKDSLRVSAVLYDAVQHHRLRSFHLTGTYEDPQTLADSLAFDIMEELAERRLFGAWHLSSVGTESPVALRRFLRAEWYLRRFQLDSARQYYERAIIADTGFALAYRGLGEADAWKNHILGYYPELALRAGALNHGLALRESLLLTTDSLIGAIATYGSRSPPAGLIRRLVATMGDWTEAYPEDPEAWFHLGDAAHHLGMLAGFSPQDAQDAFTRAIEVDPGYAPSYVHKIELDLLLDGTEAALRTIRDYLALQPAEPWAASLRLLAQLLDPRTASSPDAEQALQMLGTQAYPRFVPRDPATFSMIIATHLSRWSVDEGEANLRLARAWGYPNAIAISAAYRGHLKEAYAAVDGSDEPWSILCTSKDELFASLARLGEVPPDTASRVFARWLEARSGRGVYNALGWWADRSDTASLVRAIIFFDSLAGDTLESRASLGAYGTIAARAYLSLALADSAGAVDRLYGLAPWCWAPECHHEALTLARVLAGSGHVREALRQYARIPTPTHATPGPEVVLIALERARLQERLGLQADASRSYRFVLEAWRHADPSLTAYVEEARGAMLRLATGSSYDATHPPPQ